MPPTYFLHPYSLYMPMKPKTLFITTGIVVFVVALGFALLGEINRADETLNQSISGVVDWEPAFLASGKGEIHRDDAVWMYLLDAATGQVLASHNMGVVVLPRAYDIGKPDAVPGADLNGELLVVMTTDKDGDPLRGSPGEVYAHSLAPVKLGAREVKMVVDRPFTGRLMP